MRIIIAVMMMFFSLKAITLEQKVAYLNDVKSLIILTQKMRGDTNVYTKGGKLDAAVVQQDRREYAKAFAALDKKFRSVDKRVNTEFRQLNKYMQSLNGVAIELDNLTAFKANTLLIKEMLRIGAQVQESFFKQESPLRYQASAMMIKKILPLTEHLGQLRGLSAGAMACHRCRDDADMEYIKDHLAHTRDDVNDFVMQMLALKKSYPQAYDNSLEKELEGYKKEVDAYLDYIDLVVIEDKAPVSKEYDFFKEGTRLIARSLKFYEMNAKVLLR